MHREIEAKYPLPEGDILVHTGDFSDHGSPVEIADFDAWLGEVGQRFRHVLLIPGNHDWWHTIRNEVTNGALDPCNALSPGFMQQRFKNCRVLMLGIVKPDGCLCTVVLVQMPCVDILCFVGLPLATSKLQ